MAATSALVETVSRLSTRTAGRSEATLAADIRQFLLLSDFDLSPDEVREISLESPLGDGTRRRIDIEAGSAVIEVKKDLRGETVLSEAIAQLAGYVRDQSALLRRRYVGILTDGVEWRLFHLSQDGQTLLPVSSIVLSGSEQDRQASLTVWLDTILATATGISPLPEEIERRLGVQSASYQLDFASLSALYAEVADDPEVQLKRELWAKLLRTSFGSAFVDDQRLFIDHTLLVLTAEVIAHAVVGYDLAEVALEPSVLVSGRRFLQAQVQGVVEADFFDWIVRTPAGEQFVTTLTQRLARFDWREVNHDVLKVLYESVISAETRHTLGEYYTPDWLAHRIVDEVYTDPRNQRILDPACGSGTFIFQAVKRFLASCELRALSNADSLEALTRNVMGLDVHPVAVTFARVTYLMAIGRERLADPDRGPLSVPVYLGDSVQWDQSGGTLSNETIRISTEGSDLSDLPTGFLFDSDLEFPEALLGDSGRFDRLVADLADMAMTYTGGTVPSVRALLTRAGLSSSEQAVVENTFNRMCELHASGRDHIWGYYIRNLVRPLWLSLNESNRVDVLVGNVPWLKYSSMTGSMQERFTALSMERNLITTPRGVSSRDLSSLFVVRSVELYLKDGGTFAFVMPRGALSRQPYEGFRSASWKSHAQGDLKAHFSTPWDLDGVRPHIFPAPSCVVFGTRSGDSGTAMPSSSTQWVGQLPAGTVDWEVAGRCLATVDGSVEQVSAGDSLPASPYRRRFRQGAVLAPRALLFVLPDTSNPLGAGAGRTHVVAQRSTLEKPPWRDIPTLRGTVESSQLFPVYLGETVLPYRVTMPRTAALPILDDHVMSSEEVEELPAFAEWWLHAEEKWREFKKGSDDSSLMDRIDFHKHLSAQLPPGGNIVAYTKAGNSLNAARVSHPKAIIDLKLYWCRTSSIQEARYLLAILNSEALRARVEPFQPRGLFGPRDFDKYIFRVAFPEYSARNALHAELADAAGRAEDLAATVDVEDMGFVVARRAVRSALDEAGLTPEIEGLVARLLAG